MHNQICAFPSKTLYGSKLKSHLSVASHLLHDLSNAQAGSEEDEKDLLQTPVVFFDTAGCEYFERLDGDGDEGSRCNENEATIVSNWVDKLVWLFQDLLVTMKLRVRLQVQVGIKSSQIAIITP
jgi:DNA polymerase alpha-associated DNA helicase A